MFRTWLWQGSPSAVARDRHYYPVSCPRGLEYTDGAAAAATNEERQRLANHDNAPALRIAQLAQIEKMEEPMSLVIWCIDPVVGSGEGIKR